MTGAKAAVSHQPEAASESLDPANWSAFRQLCHRMLDEAIDHLHDIGDGPVWRPVPDFTKQTLNDPAPREPEGLQSVCVQFRHAVLPYATGNTHPRFFGWVHGSGTPGGMMAEFLAAAMNSNLGGREHAAIYVERQVINWARELCGYPADASGLLVSGTSMGNLTALNVARNKALGSTANAQGVGASPARLVAYTSAEAHSSIAKAMEILGIGHAHLRAVPTLPDYRIDVAELARMVLRDRADGWQPFCVIGTAGTVNTGAIDDLAALSTLCRREQLWFHVDCAFGAAALLSDKLKPRLKGIENSDSLAFDFHKWFHVPYDAGCVLVRDEKIHRETFASRPDYLAPAARGLAGGNPWPCEYGPELSRGFRALKVWFTWKEHGSGRLGRKVEDNCRQAQVLAERVAAHPNLELLAPVPLNVVCLRYTRPELTNMELDDLNNEIVIALQEQGIAAPSTTRLHGDLAIRVNITNHRTRDQDIEILTDAILAAGDIKTR